MSKKDNVKKALELLEEIHSECILAKDLNTNEILYLIGKVAGLLENDRQKLQTS